MKKQDGIKCACGKIAASRKNLKFNGFTIDGWVCIACKETYYEPMQAERILLLNKLMRERFHLKLSQIRSNLVIRIPKEVGEVLKLRKGGYVDLGFRSERELFVHASDE